MKPAPRSRSAYEAAAALGRAARCRALARALDTPSPDVRVEVQRRFAAVLATTDEVADSGERTALAAAAAAFAAAGDHLAGDHVRLFGPAGRASLVETAWGDTGRLLGTGATLADLGGFYRAFGVEPSATCPRPEDHLALELEFLGVLALKEAWAIAEGLDQALAVTRDAATAFLRDHLGGWVGAWREALLESDPSPAYAALAAAIVALVAAECARLGTVPSPIRGRCGDRARAAEPFTCPLADGSPTAASPQRTTS